METKTVTAEFTENYLKTVYDAVVKRLDHGDEPEDAMCMAKEMIDAFVAVHVDGSY